MWFKRRSGAPTLVTGAPPSLESTLRLADIARDSGDPATAATHYAAVLALSPDRQDVKIQLGNMLKDAGRLREADAIYREAQATAPDDADIRIQRGRVRKLLGDRAGAVALFREAATLDPDSWDAVDELATVGAPGPQQRRFEVHLRAGGSEAIMQMSRQLTAMRAVLDDMAAMLPEALGQTAIPVESYDLFRELYTVPPPPAGPRAAVTAILLLDREPLPRLPAQLSAFAGQSSRDWTLIAVGRDPERLALAERAAALDSRIRIVTAAAEEPAVAEWRAAAAVADGWILLLPLGAYPHPEALAWAAALPALAEAEAYVTDEDQGRIDRGHVVRSAPVCRAAVDYDTLLEANPFGETLIVAAAAYARLCPQPPAGSVARARGRLLIDLARDGRAGHLPHPLVTRLDASRPSLPEHRLAVEDHAAARGFADRLLIAKGEKGPSHWRARAADRRIAVVVTARDHPHEMRDFVRSLRDLATAPDHLHIVLVDGGRAEAETRAMLAELGAKRFVTVVATPPANAAQGANRAAEATDAPLLVFAHDDMVMLTEAWDERLRGQLERDDVGAVGARLLYGDDTIQHAGILLGWNGLPINDGLYEPAEAPGPARRFEVTRAVGAVSGAFLATRRDLFLRLGGFEAAALPGAYADIDICLKLRAAGQRVLYCPSITLRIHERKGVAMDQVPPKAAVAHAADLVALTTRWGAAIESDPGLNPIWHAATMPYRLLSAPSAQRVLGHLRATASRNPWAVPPARAP